MHILLGSHGTGKSTLLKAIHKARKDIIVFDGISRPVKKALEEFHCTPNKYEEQSLINELTSWNYQHQYAYKNILVSRSIIDAIIYSEYLLENFGERGTAKDYYLHIPEMVQIFNRTKKNIHNIFYLPIEFRMTSDEHRYSEEAQKDIDQSIIEFLRKYKCKCIVTSGTVKQRVSTILKYI